MELIKKNIQYIKAGKQTFDQFYVDEDLNVPDTKEDIRQIVKSDAKTKIEDIRKIENYLKLSGKLQYQILYITDEAEPVLSVLEGTIPFEEMVYIDNKEPGVWFVENIRTEFQNSLVHSRKVNVRATLELVIGREVTENEEVTIDIEGADSVYKKKKKVNLLGLEMTKKDTYRIKEEIVLPGTKESIGRILLTDITKRKLEFRLMQDEIRIQGELMVFCMYLSEEGKTDWITQTVPYEGKIPCAGLEEGMYYHVHNSLEDTLLDVRLDEDGEMRVLGIEGTLNVRMNIYQETEMEILEDMYSLEKVCQFDTKENVYEELIVQNHSKCKLSEKLQLPELKDDVLQVCSCDGNVQMEHTEITENGIHIEGILHVSFLYLRANDESAFGSWTGMVPFSWQLECPEMEADAQYNISYHVEQMSVSMAGSEAVEIKTVFAFDTFVRRPVYMQMITSVEMKPIDMEEIENRPGIVGYVVKDGDELWSLAKRYMTTVTEIQKINNLDSEVIKTGDVLLILKENMGILR